MRVALAHLLLTGPDVLMLDEPTNHLDAETQAWFERFLLRSRQTVLAVSHDTAFLNCVVTHIWEIHRHTIRTYTGNYDRYLTTRRAREEQLEAAAQAQERESARVQRFVDRFRAKATKARQVQSRLKQLGRVQLTLGDRLCLLAQRKVLGVIAHRAPRRIGAREGSSPCSGSMSLRSALSKASRSGP